MPGGNFHWRKKLHEISHEQGIRRTNCTGAAWGPARVTVRVSVF